jgi:hypothetical protein
VDELEHKLQEREELDDLRLDHELTDLATHESSLNSHEDTLTAKRKALEDAHVRLLAHELTADMRESGLNSKAVELAEKEKQVAKQQMQDLAAAQKRLEELQASRAGEALGVWDFLGQTKAAPVLLGFSPLRSGPPSIGGRHRAPAA